MLGTKTWLQKSLSTASVYIGQYKWPRVYSVIVAL
jgi:hypothetical protein